MRIIEGISKCLECGHVDESKHFSVLVAIESYVRLCPHCRAGKSHLLDDLEGYVLSSAMGDQRSMHYTLVNNEFGHCAVADRDSGTRLTTWGSHVHVINEFCSTEHKAIQLAGEGKTRVGTDQRLFNLPVPGRGQPSRADVAVGP